METSSWAVNSQKHVRPRKGVEAPHRTPGNGEKAQVGAERNLS